MMKPNHDGTLDEEKVHSYNAPICAIILSTAQSAGSLVFLPMQCFHPLKYKKSDVDQKDDYLENWEELQVTPKEQPQDHRFQVL